eukprot:5556280-Pyramimonas_sp.AAC.1
MLALDWKKAFDSINVTALLDALRVFGVPPHMLTLIGNIYDNKRFCVADGRQKSSIRNQQSGIAQGCPLSPLLFAMVTSVVIKNAEDKLDEASLEALAAGDMSVLLYADDILLVGRHA